MRFSLPLMLGVAGLALLFPNRADAGVLLRFDEVGSDVVATGSGSLNLSGMSFMGGFGGYSPHVRWRIVVQAGSGANVDGYSGLTGPALQVIAPSATSATSSTGATVGMSLLAAAVFVPQGYASGAPLNNTTTWASQTFASLSLVPGVYTWNLPNDTFTVAIGNPVPEPSTFAMLSVGALALAMGRRLRR